MYAKQNKNYNYILNCVDVYSRYSFIRLLKKKDAISVRDQFIDIVESINVKPNIIQSDNGTEFLGLFAQYLKENDIRHILNSSYSPNQNSIVERSNRDIRNIINLYMASNNTKEYFTVIEKVQIAKNTNYNSNIKASPIDLWMSNKVIITNRIIPKTIMKPEDKHLILAYENNQKSNRMMEKFKEQDNFRVDDNVMVSMEAVFSKYRKRIKAGESKYMPIRYLPKRYTIYKVILSRKPTTRNRYMLQNPTTMHVISKNTKDGLKYKYLTANDIILCPPDIQFDITVDQALKLNGITPSRDFDLNYE
jgi:hypothetical protein